MTRIRQDFNSHVGDIWENCCARAVSFSDLFGQEWGMASRWWGNVPVRDEYGKVVGNRDVELDVVAENRDNGRLLVGECKWAAADYAGRLLHVLKSKVSQVSQFGGREIEYVLFLREKPIDADAVNDAQVHILYPADVIPLLR